MLAPRFLSHPLIAADRIAGSAALFRTGRGEDRAALSVGGDNVQRCAAVEIDA
jgi:hypothetical protein